MCDTLPSGYARGNRAGSRCVLQCRSAGRTGKPRAHEAEFTDYCEHRAESASYGALSGARGSPDGANGGLNWSSRASRPTRFQNVDEGFYRGITKTRQACHVQTPLYCIPQEPLRLDSAPRRGGQPWSCRNMGSCCQLRDVPSQIATTTDNRMGARKACAMLVIGDNGPAISPNPASAATPTSAAQPSRRNHARRSLSVNQIASPMMRTDTTAPIAR